MPHTAQPWRSRMPLIAIFVASGATFAAGLGLAIALLFRP
jgi:hypothetical protein